VDGSWSWAIIPCEENNKGLLFQNKEPLENNLNETEVKQTDKGLRGYGVPTEYPAVTMQHEHHNTYNNAHNTYAGESIGNTCKPLTPLRPDIVDESGRGTTRAFIVSPSPEETCGDCEDENIIWVENGTLSLRAKEVLALVDAKTDAGRSRKLAHYLKKHKGRIYNIEKGRCELKSSAKRDALMWSLEVYHEDTIKIPPEKTELFQAEVVKVVKVVEKPEEKKEKRNTDTHTHDGAHAYT